MHRYLKHLWIFVTIRVKPKFGRLTLTPQKNKKRKKNGGYFILIGVWSAINQKYKNILEREETTQVISSVRARKNATVQSDFMLRILYWLLSITPAILWIRPGLQPSGMILPKKEVHWGLEHKTRLKQWWRYTRGSKLCQSILSATKRN